MKKILLSVLSVGVVAVVAVFATQAFFSDEEKSVGNTFTAGKLDLVLNSVLLGIRTPIDGPLFELKDMKPGDLGERTVELYVDDNPACGFVSVDVKDDKDNSCTEPELVDENDCTPDGAGELNDEVQFAVWEDPNCNNVYEPVLNERILTQGTLTEDKSYGIGGLPVKNANAPGRCFGIGYCFGEWKTVQVNDVTKVKCDGSLLKNESQTDSFVADLVVRAEQYRNQYGPESDFPNGCPIGDVADNDDHRLVLENENVAQPEWIPIVDGIQGILTWEGDGTTFDFTLTAHGLPANTAYSLIYYADPYPGNNPGGLIWSGNTDGAGSINTSGNPDLGFDIPTAPDTNIVAHSGGKVWLIPSANYNVGTRSVTPWTPDNTTWLFEGNVYINYNDTNWP